MHISSLVQEHAASHTAGYNSDKRQDGTYLQAAVANSAYTRCREYQGMLPSFPSHNAPRHIVAITEASFLCINRPQGCSSAHLIQAGVSCRQPFRDRFGRVLNVQICPVSVEACKQSTAVLGWRNLARQHAAPGVQLPVSCAWHGQHKPS